MTNQLLISQGSNLTKSDMSLLLITGESVTRKGKELRPLPPRGVREPCTGAGGGCGVGRAAFHWKPSSALPPSPAVTIRPAPAIPQHSPGPDVLSARTRWCGDRTSLLLLQCPWSRKPRQHGPPDRCLAATGRKPVVNMSKGV